MKWLAPAALLAAMLAGCGARTGLRTPDVPGDNAGTPDVPPPEFCIDLEPDAGSILVNLETQPQLSVADVLFVIDRTGSMDQEIDNIKANLQRTIVPSIAATIGDVQFGVVTYADFPIDPYGDPSDRPFTLVTPVDRSVANVQGAVNSIRVGGGGDNPEAMVEALYQVGTGEGYAPWISPRSPCPAPGRLGYPCFRPNAQSIVVLIADAPSHNGPTADRQYQPPAFTARGAAGGPHTYNEAIQALNNIRARVIGISSGVEPYSGRRDLERIAMETNAVSLAGTPLVFDIGSDGRDLDTRVVSAIQTFTRQVRFDASARIVDVDPERPASALVRAIRPAFASPQSGIQGQDGNAFLGVIPGTRLTFTIEIQNTTIPRGPLPQRIPARVQFLGDGRPNLGTRDITIVIPAESGEGCNARGDAGVSDAGSGGGIDAGP